MRIAILFTAFALLIGGCSTMVDTTDDYGGVRRGPRSGTVKYRNGLISGGWNKGAAVRKMRDFCAPRGYRIIQTWEDSYNQFSKDGSSTRRSWIYVSFRCA